MTRRHWPAVGASVALLAALVATPGAAFAKQGPPVSEAGNNLSVPTIFLPGTSAFATLACDGSLVAPSGTPSSGYEEPGYFYVQGVNAWQAECETATSGVTATVDFGDNLSTVALKAGTPIRVEVSLLDNADLGATLQGYTVVKLQPSLADNLSAYGTKASSGSANAAAFPVNFDDSSASGMPIRVYVAGASFQLHNDTTNTDVVVAGTPMSAEINSTGAVVYGYNWGVGQHGVKNLPTAGTYTLTFTIPSYGASFDGVLNEGEAGVATSFTSNTASITFTVAGGGGKGGRSGH